MLVAEKVLLLLVISLTDQFMYLLPRIFAQDRLLYNEGMVDMVGHCIDG